jgi:hypothetical protein
VNVDQYIDARNRLLDKDLIGFDGRLFQVLSLPDRPVIVKPIEEVRDGGWFSLGETVREIIREKRYGINPNR